MELFDGHLFVHLNLGTGAAKVRASRKPLNDGNWHRVELTLKNKVGRITVDGNTEAFESPGKSFIQKDCTLKGERNDFTLVPIIIWYSFAK